MALGSRMTRRQPLRPSFRRDARPLWAPDVCADIAPRAQKVPRRQNWSERSFARRSATRSPVGNRRVAQTYRGLAARPKRRMQALSRQLVRAPCPGSRSPCFREGRPSPEEARPSSGRWSSFSERCTSSSFREAQSFSWRCTSFSERCTPILREMHLRPLREARPSLEEARPSPRDARPSRGHGNPLTEPPPPPPSPPGATSFPHGAACRIARSLASRSRALRPRRASAAAPTAVSTSGLLLVDPLRRARHERRERDHDLRLAGGPRAPSPSPRRAWRGRLASCAWRSRPAAPRPPTR